VSLADALALGRSIICPDPDCGRICWVEPSRQMAPRLGGIPPPSNLANPGPASGTTTTAHLWMLVYCPRTGGKLFPSHTPVELSDG
jgi:hypothetical protein